MTATGATGAAADVVAEAGSDAAASAAEGEAAVGEVDAVETVAVDSIPIRWRAFAMRRGTS